MKNVGRAVLATLLALGAGVCSAQSSRDPTQPPGMGSAGGGVVPARAGSSGWSVIVVDGRAHVAVGTRLYAEGQMLGRARIERITETEIWLREDRNLRKVALYPGVQRRSASEKP
jgi:hypothetical protein